MFTLPVGMMTDRETPNTFSFDLTQPTLPSGLVATRTGADFYPDVSATVAALSTTAEVFEDRGDAQGGGFWTFPSYTNEAASKMFDFSSGGGWTHNGSPTYTANAATAPDGTSTADRVADPGSGATSDVLFSATGLASNSLPLLASVWVKDVSGSAPTATGALAPVPNGVVGSSTLGAGTAWRHASTVWFNTSARTDSYIDIFPAGAAVQPDGSLMHTNAETGAVDLWGAQAYRGRALLPLVAGTSGDLTISAVTPANSLAENGDLHIEGAFLMDTLFNNGGPPGGDPYVIFEADTAGGAFRLEYTDQVINGYFNDANIISSVTFTLNIGYLDQRGELRWEFWNRPSVGDSGMQFFLSGERINSVRSTSVAQGTPTSFNLGHQAGAYILPRRHTLLDRITRDIDAANGVILGDSIVAAYSPYSSVGSRILTVPESKERQIVSYATPGNTVSQQHTAWSASAQSGASDVEWVLVHVGVDDFIAGDSAATVTGRLQDLIDDINADNPTAKIILSPLLPCKANASVGATVWGRIQTYNDNIAGTGGTPITGSNLIVLPYWSDADDGSGNLIAGYDSGDGLHQNTAGRQYMAGVYRAALIANGLL